MAEKLSKKLPKRTSRPRHKAYRALCWARQERRKDDREVEGIKAFERNEKLRAQGLPTPWQVAKAKRYARRHAE